MLTASAIDAMLKHKGLRDGSLNARIDAAAKNHLITDEMAAWAHEIRLDANDQRHADEGADLPTPAEAEKTLAFADASRSISVRASRDGDAGPEALRGLVTRVEALVYFSDDA